MLQSWAIVPCPTFICAHHGPSYAFTPVPSRHTAKTKAATVQSTRMGICSAKCVTAQFVPHKISDPLATIAQEPEQAGIDEIGMENTVARCDFRPHRIGGVPRVIANGERIPAVGRKPHLRPLRQTAVGKLFVKDRPDVRG